MTSIRTFLVVVLISMITLVSFLTALHGYRESMREARELFQDQLRQQAGILNAVSVEHMGNTISPAFARKNDEPNNAYQVFNEARELLIRSANAPEQPMAEFTPGYSDINFSGYRWHAFVMSDISTEKWIMVAERDDVRYRLTDSIIMEAVFPTVISIPLAGVLVWVIVSLGLKPIQNLANQLRNKQATDLTPIDSEHVPRELKMMAASANDLLNRLARTFEREQRFNSDVAHELRTPIAALKIHLQNLLAELDSPVESALKLEEGIQRMNHVIEQIIMLNRMTPDHYMAQFVNLDLVDVIRRVIEDVFDEANTRKQKLEVDCGPCVIFGDAFAIETLVKNILQNAVRYTPESGKIMIRTRDSNEGRELQIIDSGPGIAEEDYERIFERFHRLGGDRNPSYGKGCGLGLSIVKYIADLHQASIVLGPSEYETGLSFKVIFPGNRSVMDTKPDA